MKYVYYFFQSLLVMALVIPLAIVPHRFIPWTGRLIGKIAFYIWKSRRDIAIGAVQKTIDSGCFPSALSPEDVAKESFIHLAQSFLEIIKVYFTGGEKILESVSIQGIEHYYEARDKEKGVIIITGHYGNWELLALAFSRKISKAHAVARKQNNPFLNFLVERIRQHFGNSVIYKKGALKKIFSVLRSNGVVGILYDQCVIEDEGVLVDFLCRKAWTMKIPIILSQKTGAPLLPVFIKKMQSGRHTIMIDRPFYPDKGSDLLENISKMNGYIEDQIRKDATQWLWIHRRWKRTNS